MLQPAKSRKEPFVWVTWASSLLAGESHCQWASWFRAHYFYYKIYSPFDKENWALSHTSLVSHTVKQLEGAGYQVLIEGQNRFNLKGASGTVLAGCPDIVAIGDGGALVVDCKTGKQRMSHEYQVMVYMLALPYAQGQYRRTTFDGLVQYENDALFIPASRVDDRVRAEFRAIMESIGGVAELRRVPSPSDCRFCDIAAQYCPERVEFKIDQPVKAEELF